MDKSTTKFCPDCGHHLYLFKIISPGKCFCVECGQWYEPEEAITLEQAQPIRDAWKEKE